MIQKFLRTQAFEFEIETSTVLCLVAQLCLTLSNPMGCSPPGSSVHGDSPGNNTGVGCHALLQGVFLTQGSNLDLLHCRWILYHLSHQGIRKLVITEYLVFKGAITVSWLLLSGLFEKRSTLKYVMMK